MTGQTTAASRRRNKLPAACTTKISTLSVTGYPKPALRPVHASVDENKSGLFSGRAKEAPKLRRYGKVQYAARGYSTRMLLDRGVHWAEDSSGGQNSGRLLVKSMGVARWMGQRKLIRHLQRDFQFCLSRIETKVPKSMVRVGWNRINPGRTLNADKHCKSSLPVPHSTG